MAGYLARYPAIWIGDWLSGGLIGCWLAHWLADWVVACSLAGCLAVWRLIGGAGRLVIWGPGDLDLAGCLYGYEVGWKAIWLAI